MYRNILTLKTRREIYDIVSRYPGLHLREIERRLKLPFSTIRYHLDFLEKRELIKGKVDGRYTRFYATEKIGRHEKKILNLFRQDTPRDIILFLLTHIYSSQIEMSRGLEKHPTTIEFHLKKLLENEIVEIVEPCNGKICRDITPHVVECEPIGKEVIYVLKDPYAIYDLLILHKSSLMDDTANSFVLDFLDDLGKIPEHVNNPRDIIDLAIEAFFEVFPHPYHV